MANFLKNHQKNEIRAKISEDIILKNPSKEQLDEIRNILLSQLQVKEGLDVEGEISYEAIRYIIRECCVDGEFIDEYSDEQLEEEFENGDSDVQKLKFEIIMLIEEIVEEYQMYVFKTYKEINSMINILNSNVEEQKMYEKIQKLLKKNKVDISVEEMIKYKDNPEMISKLIEESKVRNNKSKKK